MRILIIEDEHKIADSLKRGLSQERMNVDVAYDGEEGFDLASSDVYDCIILDLMLPSMSGEMICKNLRSDGIMTPILMLTAKGTLQDKIDGFTVGSDDYLVKPFAFAELLARVRALSRRKKLPITTILTAGNLTLYSDDFVVKRSGRTITLSRKEFDLLAFLLRHKGKVLSKEQLIANVWEYESDVLPNTVEVYMGYLRNKIDKPFTREAPLITTVRGFGYKVG